jgi:hypothetical protein
MRSGKNQSEESWKRFSEHIGNLSIHIWLSSRVNKSIASLWVPIVEIKEEIKCRYTQCYYLQPSYLINPLNHRILSCTAPMCHQDPQYSHLADETWSMVFLLPLVEAVFGIMAIPTYSQKLLLRILTHILLFSPRILSSVWPLLISWLANPLFSPGPLKWWNSSRICPETVF